MGILNPKALRSARKLRNLLGADRSDIRLWFTGLNEAFEGAHLDEYPSGYKKKIQAPWPQPSPHFPDEMAPSVLHVPEGEIEEFLDRVVSRYVSTLRSGWLESFGETWLKGGLEPVSDEEFSRILVETPFARMLCDRLDPIDEENFKPLLRMRAPDKPGTLYKLDLSPLGQVRTHPGQEFHSNITLLECFPNGRFQALGILLDRRLLTPADQSHWELAKYFVLQGCANALIASLHPRIHFPVDSINAITKTLLPDDHRLARLLLPHCYMQLPLNFAVLYIDRSVAHNHQREIYTPFPMTRDGFMQLIKLGYTGVPENSAWPKYRFEMGGDRLPGPYGRYLDRYYDVVLEFTRGWLKDAIIDEATVKWADAIAGFVPGFPDATKLRESPDLLAQAAATFIHNVSIVHSADHIVYARESVRKVPLRLRALPPRTPEDNEQAHLEKLDRGALVRRGDIFRHLMARKMYFGSNTIRKLVDIKYDCRAREEQLASSEFFRAMRLLDRKPEMQKFVRLEGLASSIQY
jgi:hypothetical protein